MDAHHHRHHRCRSRALLASALGVAAVLVAATASTAGAAAGEATGLSTGRGHTVRVLRRAATGIEAGMPRDGAYGKALELDRLGKYRQAYRMFRKAKSEFRALKRKRSFDKRINDWITKASRQGSISYSISRYKRYRSRYRYRRYYRRFYRLFRYATNCHKKWLAIRAFGLEAPRKLATTAIKAYKDLLKKRTRPRYRSRSYQVKMAWLQLGGLYAELGRHGEARRAYRKVGSMRRSNTYQAAAYYHAALGQRKRAMTFLRKAVGRSSWRRRQVRRSNFFDSLRGDPRFEALVNGKR